MEIIKLILDEEAAAELPMDILHSIAAITNDVVMPSVLKYLKDPGANPKVKDKIYAVYADKLNTDEFLGSEEVADAMNRIRDLRYEDINPLSGVEKLRQWEKDISFILSSAYAVPYIPPVTANLVKTVKENIEAYVDENNVPTSVRRFASNFSKNTFLFKDKPSARAKGTAVKKVIRNKNQYEVMGRGITFLLDKIETGKNPASWRYL